MTDQFSELFVESQRHIPWIIYDSDGNIADTNPGLSELYGYSAEELKGKPRSFLIVREDQKSAFNMKSEIDPALEIVMDKFGIQHEVLVICYPIPSHPAPLVAEQHISKWLQMRMCHKMPFEKLLHRILHDIKGPVRHLCTYTEMLLNQPEAEKSQVEKWREYLTIAKGKLTTLFENLAMYLQAGLPDAPSEMVSLEAIIDHLKRKFQVPIKLKGNAQIYGNVGQLTQVFEILVQNSITFKSPDRPLAIDITVEKKGKFWLFRYQDNGIGIPLEDKERIFELFEKGMNAIDSPGNGVGLALARKIINVHGGNIWAESTLNQNAIFYLSLPLGTEK